MGFLPGVAAAVAAVVVVAGGIGFEAHSGHFTPSQSSPHVTTASNQSSPVNSTKPPMINSSKPVQSNDPKVLFANLPFMTTVPTNMKAERITRKDGVQIRFYPVINIQKGADKNGYIEIFYPSTSMTKSAMKNWVKSHYGNVTKMASRDYVWSEEEYQLSTSTTMSRVSIGQHGGSYFAVGYKYPADWADSMSRYQAQIQKNWVWTNTNTKLGN